MQKETSFSGKFEKVCKHDKIRITYCDNEQCLNSRVQRKITKQKQSGHRPVKKQQNQVPWRSDHPQLTGHNRSVLSVVIEKNGNAIQSINCGSYNQYEKRKSACDLNSFFILIFFTETD